MCLSEISSGVNRRAISHQCCCSSTALWQEFWGSAFGDRYKEAQVLLQVNLQARKLNLKIEPGFWSHTDSFGCPSYKNAAFPVAVSGNTTQRGQSHNHRDPGLVTNSCQLLQASIQGKTAKELALPQAVHQVPNMLASVSSMLLKLLGGQQFFALCINQKKRMLVPTEKKKFKSKEGQTELDDSSTRKSPWPAAASENNLL